MKECIVLFFVVIFFWTFRLMLCGKLSIEPDEKSEPKIAKNAFKLLKGRSKEIFESFWAKREKKANRITAYDVLEIAPTNSQAEIKKAYKDVVKKYHPDLNPSKSSGLKFRKIKKAYDLLSDEKEKAKYDSTLVERTGMLLLVGFSVQQLRLTLAKDFKINSKMIKFTQTGDVFIDDDFAYCWDEFNGFFVCYKSATPKNMKFDQTIHEIIYLTSYDMLELEEMIAIDFGCDTSDINLRYSEELSEYDHGIVLKRGEFALCWRETDKEFYEYYCPIIPNESSEADVEDIPEKYDFSDDEDGDGEIKELSHN